MRTRMKKIKTKTNKTWLNRDVATKIRDYADPMTYGNLLCTSKLFGHNENPVIKLKKIRVALYQLNYELYPYRPKTAFSQFEKDFKSEFYKRDKTTYLGIAHGFLQLDAMVEQAWRNISKEEMERYRKMSIEKHAHFNKAKKNLQIPHQKRKLKARIKSAGKINVKLEDLLGYAR